MCIVEARVGRQQGLELRRGQGVPEQRALEQVAAGGYHHRRGAGGADVLGADTQPELVGAGDQGADDRHALRVGGHVIDQPAGHLDAVQRQQAPGPGQVGTGRAGGAQGEADAAVLELLQGPLAGFRDVAVEGDDFELEALGRQAGFDEQGMQLRRKLGQAQHLDVRAEGQGQRPPVALGPAGNPDAGLPQGHQAGPGEVVEKGPVAPVQARQAGVYAAQEAAPAVEAGLVQKCRRGCCQVARVFHQGSRYGNRLA